MSSFEVETPILNSPFEEPGEHWWIVEGEQPVRRKGRRPALYYYRDPRDAPSGPGSEKRSVALELKLVNRIRERVKAWRSNGWDGVTGTTLELLRWWRRPETEKPRFFAQLEAVETVIFLNEARPDHLQGLEIPFDEPTATQKEAGIAAFRRYACKMATGTGKTAVMGMIAAWSILNKIADRSDRRFSDVVLVLCPSVTIRSRLGELDPNRGEASIYRRFDLLPPHLMPQLTRGRILVTNWHVFERHTLQATHDGARVVRAGVQERTRETIRIGPKSTTARGTRYLALEDYHRQVAAGLLEVIEEIKGTDGSLERVVIESVRYVESDTAWQERILGREIGGKQNLLVINDEAHHAYRIRREVEAEASEEDEEIFGEDEEAEEFYREATVWVEGLDRIHQHRGINFCLDLSATPYYLGRVGTMANRPFPWVVSDFGLMDAIESGLVKIPQMAVRDSSGAQIPGYFNIWRWIMDQLSARERGARRSGVQPEAILKYAHHPIAMLGGIWEKEREEWAARAEDPRPPVFIIVCKNTRIAKVVYEWLAENRPPEGIPPARIEGFLNRDGRINTIRVDSKVVHETDSGESKSDETRWMRFTLDTVGRMHWPADRMGRPIHPEGFAELAGKLQRPLHPPGRDVRCIVSVGMLTEGWDCNTVTHIIGLRPFMSQLLCEQVVGRGLRRVRYTVNEEGRFTEEVAKIFGVPFEVVPCKATTATVPRERHERHHVHALPERAQLEIRFPRVEGYAAVIKNRVTLDWGQVAPLNLDPDRYPAETEVGSLLISEKGTISPVGPGRHERLTLNDFRERRREQELVFDLAGSLTRSFCLRDSCEVPAHVLFPQFVQIVQRYLREKVEKPRGSDVKDVFLAPYYGWMRERILDSVRADFAGGQPAESPVYETNRGPGTTADVEFWTSKDVREVRRSHVNFMVADTKRWEQAAAYQLDQHPAVDAFVKNAGLGFAIPYLHDGQIHDYLPDFIIRLAPPERGHLILETKGFDPLKAIKKAAAERWAQAVTAEESFGRWQYVLVEDPGEVVGAVNGAARTDRAP